MTELLEMDLIWDEPQYVVEDRGKASNPTRDLKNQATLRSKNWLPRKSGRGPVSILDNTPSFYFIMVVRPFWQNVDIVESRCSLKVSCLP